MKKSIYVVLALLLVFFASGCSKPDGADFSGSGEKIIEVVENPDGTETIVTEDGRGIIVGGDAGIGKEADMVITNPDGSVTVINKDGTKIEVPADDVKDIIDINPASVPGESVIPSATGENVTPSATGGSSSDPELPDPPKQALVNTGGGIAAVGEWVYYSNTRDEFKLYKKNTNGRNEKKLSDTPCYSLYVFENTIAYLTNTNPASLRLISVNGGNSRQILENVYRSSLVSDGEWIYYRDFSSNCLCRIKPDGTQNAQLTDFTVNDFAAGYGFLYYRRDKDGGADGDSDPAIYRMLSDGSGAEKIYDQSGSGRICRNVLLADGGYVFYNEYDEGTRTHYIYRINPDGTGKVRLSSGNHSQLAPQYFNGRLYYRAVRDGRLYSVKTDGTDTLQLTGYDVDFRDCAWAGYVIYRDWAYYTKYRLSLDGGDPAEW